MYNRDTILIASTSRAIIVNIQNRLGEIRAGDNVISVLNSGELLECLEHNNPKYLLIEGSFIRDGTPEEILRIIKRFSSLRVYVFSYHENTDIFLKSLFRAGIEGYLDLRKGKGALRDELRLVLSGKMLVPPQFKGMSFDSLDSDNAEMTDRDMEVIHLIFEGLSNKEIGEVLHIKEQSVKNHRESIYHKLHTRGAIGILKQIFRKGVMSMEDFLAS